jgi:hypothetical protein
VLRAETLETILVVDDTAAVLKLIAAILEAANFHVLQANSGASAVKVAAFLPIRSAPWRTCNWGERSCYRDKGTRPGAHTMNSSRSGRMLTPTSRSSNRPGKNTQSYSQCARSIEAVQKAEAVAVRELTTL